MIPKTKTLHKEKEKQDKHEKNRGALFIFFQQEGGKQNGKLKKNKEKEISSPRDTVNNRKDGTFHLSC